MSLLSTKWCGNEMVPLSHDTLYLKRNGLTHVVSFLNDSFEIGLGWPDRWHVMYRRDEFDRIIAWYLWKRCWSEWFGLRRWCYYKLLHNRVKRWRPRTPLP